MENKSPNALPDIRHTLVFNAPIQKVWDAVATSEGIAAWFMPNNFEPVAGFEFHVDAGPFGKAPCKVLEIDPPNRLLFQWTDDWTITFELKALEEKTEFTLIHSGWDADKMTGFGQTHTMIRGTMDQGWAGLVQKLGSYVEA
ncbi:SRPBCC family protein [Paenibacillus thalictri]|uniref:SRPBCC domain-containing protein n=1 Tax=Paenibacillus thalictri TaxID=2527873 RepID=A0A4Q9DMZ9_9BACL|nr:SRPBCC domain-containing protein [Paenibacillus thalictri]TBL77265.1 SRPBCC domain-containing protein [Paenibacillus thalictri]